MQPRRRDYSFVIAFLSSLVINSGMIGIVVVHARPSQSSDLAMLHPPQAKAPTTMPSGPEYLPDDEPDDATPPPPQVEPKAPPPPPKPKVQMDNRQAFGEKNGTGEALNSSPGNEPMQAMQGPQVQAFLGRNPSQGKHQEGKPVAAGGGGDNGGGGQPQISAHGPNQQPQPPTPAPKPDQQSPQRQPPAKPIPVEHPTPTKPNPAERPTPTKPNPSQRPTPPQPNPSQQPTPPRPNPAQRPVNPQQNPTQHPTPAKPEPAQHPQPPNPQAQAQPPSKPPPESSKLNGKGTAPNSSPPAPDEGGNQPERQAAVPAPAPKPPSDSTTVTPTTAPVAVADQSTDPLMRQPISPSISVSQPPPPDASQDFNSPPQDSTERLLALASQPPSPAQSSTNPPGKPGAPGPLSATASTSDPAPPSDRDSDPFSTKNSIVFVNGKVYARNGRWVKTVRPNLTEAGYIDAALLPNPMVTFLAAIDEQGNVTRVILYRSSGSDNIDLPCQEALNDWKIEPSKDKNGKPMKDLVSVTFGLPH